MSRFSTEDVTTKFNKHGAITYDFVPEQRVLYIYGEGPFNEETIRISMAVFLESIAPAIKAVAQSYVEVLFCR